MPELPEVEVIKRGLSGALPGQKVTSVAFNWPKSFPNAKADIDNFLIGAKITGVKRRAKVLIITLDSGYSLVIHLKMTGQLIFVNRAKGGGQKGDERFGGGHPTGSLAGQLPDKSTRVTFGLGNAARLFFNDQRKFGWVRLIPTAEISNIDFFKTVGPEPLSASFGPKQFKDRLYKRPKSVVKAVLLDQRIIAGIGNIYADESLWAAKIHPLTPVHRLTPQEIATLYSELIRILKLSIKNGGSTDKNYVNASGQKGNYLKIARVFRRNGQPCPRCGQDIIKMRVAARGTHICPKCQKEPKT